MREEYFKRVFLIETFFCCTSEQILKIKLNVDVVFGSKIYNWRESVQKLFSTRSTTYYSQSKDDPFIISTFPDRNRPVSTKIKDFMNPTYSVNTLMTNVRKTRAQSLKIITYRTQNSCNKSALSHNIIFITRRFYHFLLITQLKRVYDFLC